MLNCLSISLVFMSCSILLLDFGTILACLLSSISRDDYHKIPVVLNKTNVQPQCGHLLGLIRSATNLQSRTDPIPFHYVHPTYPYNTDHNSGSRKQISKSRKMILTITTRHYWNFTPSKTFHNYRGKRS